MPDFATVTRVKMAAHARTFLSRAPVWTASLGTTAKQVWIKCPIPIVNISTSGIYIYIYLFILDPVGPMIQHHFQEKYMNSLPVAHRQCLLTISHNLAWHTVQQSIHASQPDQLTRGPHSQLEERRLNTNKPHSYARPQDIRCAVHGRRPFVFTGV